MNRAEVARLEAAAWLAGIEHVAHCPGCSACQLFPEIKEEEPAEEETLDESVRAV